MKYYLVSPRVDGESPIDGFLQTMFARHIVMMGWGTDNRIGADFHDIRKGDFVLVAQRINWKFKYFFAGIVADSKTYEEDGFQYKKLIRFVDLRNSKMDFLANASFAEMRVVKAMMAINKYNNSECIKHFDAIIQQQKHIEIMNNYISLLKTNHNLILTGAPGTGKTYLAKEIAKEMGCPDDEIGFVQFHPSYDYTDFVEGLRPVTDRNGNVGFERKDGVFKEFCGNVLSRVVSQKYTFDPSSLQNGNYTINGDSPSSNFDLIYTSIENDIKSGRIKALAINRSMIPVTYKNYRMEFGQARPHTIKRANLELMFDYYTKHNIQDLSRYSRDDYLDLISQLTDGATKTIDYIYYAAFLQEMLNRVSVLPQKTLNEEDVILEDEKAEPVEEGIESPSLDEAYLLLVEDLKNNNKSLRFETPTGIPFSVKVDDLSRLIIGDGQYVGTHLSLKMIKGYYEGTKSGSFYKSHCKAIINYLQKTYHFHDDDYVAALLKNQTNNPPDPNKPFVFIIDEINRGEISKIFGELFFSIDPGYRGEKGRVQTQYQNMVEEGDVFKNGFYVPENVYIIGTMNDIDRSVESMDFAMRRRFAWAEVTAKESYMNMIENDAEMVEVKDEIKQRMSSLNNAILNKKLGLGEAYQIGAAYFRKVLNYTQEGYGQEEAFQMLWDNHLKGLLFEYLRGNQNAKEQLEMLHQAYEKHDAQHEGQQGEGTDD